MHPYEECHYDHFDACVEDLLNASKDPKSAIDVLTNKHSFKLKGTGPISYYFGCSFGRDDNVSLNFSPKKCIETMVDCHYYIFDAKPKLCFTSPLEKSDHSELDTSKHPDSDGAQKHQSIIGAIQWAVFLGRL